MKNVYLAGPMSGHKDYNYNVFQIVADEIRRRCPNTHVVHTANTPRGLKHEDYMEWSLSYLRHCDAVVVIGDRNTANDSKGVKQELLLARARKIPVYYHFEENVYERLLHG